jgi:hypothetical protein
MCKQRTSGSPPVADGRGTLEWVAGVSCHDWSWCRQREKQLCLEGLPSDHGPLRLIRRVRASRYCRVLPFNSLMIAARARPARLLE